jgi:hypothetical protein
MPHPPFPQRRQPGSATDAAAQHAPRIRAIIGHSTQAAHPDVVIVGAKRTAIGSFLGQFTGVPSPTLGTAAIRRRWRRPAWPPTRSMK